jgi:hypothetical protein
MPREAKQEGQGRTTLIRENDLKICELCGWLNLAANTECFVCGWHGRFERDREVVHAAVELAVRKYGRLELQHLTDPRLYREPARQTWRTRLQGLVQSVFSRFRRRR